MMDTKAVCLAILSLGDASGYEVKKRVEDVFSRFMDVAPSGIYAALKQLDQSGLVSSIAVQQAARPNKTVFTLLPAGREALTAALMACEGRHRIRSELVALLMFAEQLPAHKLGDVLSARIAELTAIQAELAAAIDDGGPGKRFLIGMGRAKVEAELAYLRGSLAGFLEELSAGRKVAATAAA